MLLCTSTANAAVLGEKHRSGDGRPAEALHTGDAGVRDADAIEGTVDAAAEAAKIAVSIAERSSGEEEGELGEADA